MKGTAVLISKDHTVTILEDVSHDVYEKLASQEDKKQLQCTIDEKEVTFKSIAKVIWCGDSIDWSYGY